MYIYIIYTLYSVHLFFWDTWNQQPRSPFLFKTHQNTIDIYFLNPFLLGNCVWNILKPHFIDLYRFNLNSLKPHFILSNSMSIDWWLAVSPGFSHPFSPSFSTQKTSKKLRQACHSSAAHGGRQRRARGDADGATARGVGAAALLVPLRGDLLGRLHEVSWAWNLRQKPGENPGKIQQNEAEQVWNQDGEDDICIY